MEKNSCSDKYFEAKFISAFSKWFLKIVTLSVMISVNLVERFLGSMSWDLLCRWVSLWGYSVLVSSDENWHPILLFLFRKNTFIYRIYFIMFDFNMILNYQEAKLKNIIQRKLNHSPYEIYWMACIIFNYHEG